MAGSKSDYLEKAILDYLIGGGSLGKPTFIHVCLSTAAYSEAATGASMTEVVGGSYARVALTNDATNFPNATGTAPATKGNAGTITFPTATASWGTVSSFYLVDAPTAGNVLYGGDLTTPKLIGSGDTASFAANAITITED